MNAIRKLQFMIKGYCDFTKRKQPQPPLQGNLNGKTFVITGANSGIGLSAAKEAAIRKARVYLLCRDKKRGDDAVNEIKKQTKNENIFLILCQLGEIDSMKQAAEELRKSMKTIDVLVHNGGCMLHQRQFTKDGIEKNFATNSFAVYYLTNLCLDLLNQNSRTIAVSSGGCLTQPLEIQDIYMEYDEYDGTKQYARNKRQQLCIMEQFGKKLPQKGKFVSMHPGWSDTPAVRTSMPDFYEKMKDKLKTPEEAADTIVWLSLIPQKTIINGEFYFERQVVSKHLPISLTSYNQKQADQLIDRLRKLGKF